MHLIAAEGKSDGLSLNNEKLELLRIRCDDNIYDTEGIPITCKHQMKYLGAMISDSSGHDVEMNQRFVIIAQEFPVDHGYGNIAILRFPGNLKFMVPM